MHLLKGVPTIEVKDLLAKATASDIRGLATKSFPLWVLTEGLGIDGHKVEFDKHRYLLPIYMDDSKKIVWQKAAQLGATVYVLLRLMYYCKNYQLNAGLYFPTDDGVQALSKTRLQPLFDENPNVFGNLKALKRKVVDTASLKQIPNIHGSVSNLYMLYLGGKASKDSVPLDIIAFDEVRLVSQKDIDQAQERISHSSHKVQLYTSTCGAIGDDINTRFMGGSQHVFSVKCNCSEPLCLAEAFPECIVEHKGEFYYRCPKCKYRIWDNQNGSYIARNPNADYNSYHVSQLNSKFISPKEIWQMYKTTTNIMEFYNAKLGLPYWSEDAAGCSQDHLNACRNIDLKWAYEMSRKDLKSNGPIAMGVDQHSENLYIVIGRKNRDGFKEIIHFEIIDAANKDYFDTMGKPVNPFEHLKKLIYDFGVSIAVVDAQPNSNDVKALCREFPGRVFEAYYHDSVGVDMVQWMDKAVYKATIRKGSKEIKNKWAVKLNKFHTLDYLFKCIRDRQIQWPEPNKLVQTVKDFENRFNPEIIVETRMYKHLKALVKNKRVLDTQNKPGKFGNTGKARFEWIFSGGDRNDPHSAHALNYFNIACERIHQRTPLIIW